MLVVMLNIYVCIFLIYAFFTIYSCVEEHLNFVFLSTN